MLKNMFLQVMTFYIYTGYIWKSTHFLCWWLFTLFYNGFIVFLTKTLLGGYYFLLPIKEQKKTVVN